MNNTPLTLDAPAKLNLFLHVGSARPDGYHPLDSLVAFADVGDVVTCAPAKRMALEVSGVFGAPLQGEAQNNLVLKAAHLLEAWALAQGIAVPGAALHLKKNLPTAAGIGGGSADAAATLKGLCHLWGLDPSRNQLQDLALVLGADVPVCLYGKPAFMSGIGEILKPAVLPKGVALVLINPGIPLSTGAVFQAFDAQGGGREIKAHEAQNFTTQRDLVSFLLEQKNDLQNVALKMLPVLDHVLEALADAGALLVRMSGSGPTCFGLFENADMAAKSADNIRQAHPDWWCVASSLFGGEAS